ncbi:type I polyketide synthase [Streptomonospora nanhaiensis]|uniref:type I polyketide synthase n=1 Tax=Streptomonospora nanhaiensis TaxID=1323731 RepID=UPI001C391752|nr:type I polyketide synthase [Streptomonospora nanhaiensis]MBV2362911.1 acyltransferase domain-containing protein [Streptomonospora nanhaiensis]
MSQRAPQDQRRLLEQAVRQLRETRSRLEAAERVRGEPVAVLGAGLRMPGGAEDLDAFWELLSTGADTVAPLTDSPDGVRPPVAERPAVRHQAGQLDRVDAFDAGFFGISPEEADRMDPQQRLVLEAAWEAAEDAGLPIERLRESTTGVFLGVYGTDYLTMQLTRTGINAYTAPGGAHSIAANRLSYLLDLHGPSVAVDTACSSSLMAVHLAVRALRQGDCDLALVGGVNLVLSPLSTEVTGRVLPLAPGGRCRAFDAAADGIVRGEGCGMLVLSRLSSARERGGRVRGVIRGTAANHDGRTNGLTAPNPRAQADLLRRALADASAAPEDVVYIEAHGTGTPLGDPIEVEGLREVYGKGDRPCAVGSVKTNFGHQEAAAGITGLIKSLLVLERGVVPPLLHLTRLNPEIDLAGSRMTLPTAPAPLPDDGRPRLAAVSSFGFGGANVHAVLEAAPPAEPVAVHEPRKLLLALSARGGAALRALADRYAERLAGADDAEAARVCAAAATGRSHHGHRVALSAADAEGLRAQLASVAAPAVPVRAGARPRVAFVFSGQGSQWAGMGRAVLDREPVVRAEVAAWDAAVLDRAGWSVLEQLTAGEDASRVNETEVAQVTIAALQAGLAALWRSWGVRPHAVVGHSMGEIAAAAAAGLLDRDQAVELLLKRARLTETGARGGAMASVALPLEEVEPLVAGVPGVGIGAVNGPRSTVVSGAPEGVEAVLARVAERGAASRRLRVEYGFHSPLLEAQGRELAGAVGHIAARTGAERIHFYSTVTGTRLEAAALTGAHWARNLRDAVLFAPAVTALAEAGVTVFVEIGPHPVLVRDIAATAERAGAAPVAVGSLRRGHAPATSLDASLGRLYAAGLDPDWEAVLGVPPAPVALPFYPWQRERHWLPAEVVDAAAAEAAEEAAAPAADPALAPGAAGAEVPLEERVAALSLFVRERIAKALGRPGAEDVPGDAVLETLALDSLVIVELKNQVETQLGALVRLQTLLEVLEGGTVDDLARAIAADEADTRAAVAAPAAAGEAR